MLNFLRHSIDHNTSGIGLQAPIKTKAFQISSVFLSILLLSPLRLWCGEDTAAPPPDITSLSLEELTATEIVSNAHFAQQIVDASSAVTVVTAEDIERFGYRTIGEILNSMRGIHVSQDGYYGFLGGRGYGAPGEYAGRIMILINGYPAAENLHNQIYINDDGYLDTALIDRVEYAPGPGSAIYGNNAVLGVVNIITLKGRDFDGPETELTTGPHHDREGRLTWGKRFDNGTEWLISASGRNGKSQYPSLYGKPETSSNRLFLKGNYRRWSLEAVSVGKTTKDDVVISYPTYSIPTTYKIYERNRFINISYEPEFINKDWKTITRLYYGDYLYDYNDIDPFNESYPWRLEGEWYGIDNKLIYLGAERHRMLFGIEYHVDTKQDALFQNIIDGELLFEQSIKDNSDIFSVYGEDTIIFSSLLSASIGGRYDRRNYDSLQQSFSIFNPRLSLLYDPTNELSLKLSYGQAGRFESVSEITYELFGPSRVRTIELAVEHEKMNRRILASLYRYRTDRLPEYSFTKYKNIYGAELESEWKWPGDTMLRFSYTWQSAKDDQGRDMPNVPRNTGKLQFSHPLFNERLSASLAVRYIGRRKSLNDTDVGGYTVTDLTFNSSRTFSDVTISLAIRNLFDTSYGHVAYTSDGSDTLEQDGRTLWLSLKYSPK
jgi:iron complex outermembrane receptor protein